MNDQTGQTVMDKLAASQAEFNHQFLIIVIVAIVAYCVVQYLVWRSDRPYREQVRAKARARRAQPTGRFSQMAKDIRARDLQDALSRKVGYPVTLEEMGIDPDTLEIDESSGINYGFDSDVDDDRDHSNPFH